MKTSSTPQQSGQPSFLGWLLLLLLGLKLGQFGEVASWSWWWVLAPAWLGMSVRFGSQVVTRLIHRSMADQVKKAGLS